MGTTPHSPRNRRTVRGTCDDTEGIVRSSVDPLPPSSAHQPQRGPPAPAPPAKLGFRGPRGESLCGGVKRCPEPCRHPGGWILQGEGASAFSGLSGVREVRVGVGEPGPEEEGPQVHKVVWTFLRGRWGAVEGLRGAGAHLVHGLEGPPLTGIQHELGGGSAGEGAGLTLGRPVRGRPAEPGGLACRQLRRGRGAAVYLGVRAGARPGT